MSASQHTPVRVYLCECGPIIKEAMDLKALAASIEANPLVSSVGQHTALCSEQGRAWLADDLRRHPDCRVVIAGCSPREHGASFMAVCRSAGINPYLLAVANIREQCSWVTPDRLQARAKAALIINAAVRRAAAQEPLAERSIEANADVLVIGAGVAGLTAASLLAGGGRRVCVVERSPAVGGRVALLGDVAPGLECASCMLAPLIQEVLHDPLIEVLSYSEVVEVLGSLGNFTARVKQRARHVEPDACFGCRSCHSVCPVEVDNAYDENLSRRKALYIPYEGALPNATLVDEAACLHFQGQDCGLCVEACPFGNIDLSSSDEVVERPVGAIIVASGAEPRPASPNLPPGAVSAMTFERLLNEAGPTAGELRLPTTAAVPRSIALLYCTDEDGTAPTEACSKVCCMAFAKYARQIRERLPRCQIYQLSWERCTGGKNYREFAATADRLPATHKIALQNGDRIEELLDSGSSVGVVYTQHGERKTLEVDLAVLAPRLVGATGTDHLSELLRVQADATGFFEPDHERLRPCSTHVGGILMAGGAGGPADIQEAAAQGAAAAGNVLSALVPGRELSVEPASATVDPDRCGRCRTCVQVCPFGAITWDEQADAAKVNELLCRGCGSCVASCPTGAMVARHFTDGQLEGEVFALGINLKQL